MMSRRHFMSMLGAAPLVAAAAPVYASAIGSSPARANATRTLVALPGSRELKFLHTHTGEKLSLEYAGRDGYLADALNTVNHFLRDFRTGDVHAIDPGLLDLLYRVNAVTQSARPFEVISGYRSPATNAMLHLRSEGVAAHSLHMVGQAIDIRLPDVPLKSLREAALTLHGGGVGYYPKSNFVHVDTGRVRFW